MGRGFKGAGGLVLLTVAVCSQLAGCGGRTSGSTSTIASGGLDAGAAAAGGAGDASPSAPDADGECSPEVCCLDDDAARAALSGKPCSALGKFCGPRSCTLGCTCVAGETGALTWECFEPSCIK